MDGYRKRLVIGVIAGMIVLAGMVILFNGLRVPEQTTSAILADPDGLVRIIFPEQSWQRQQNGYVGEDGTRCFIETMVPGSFTGSGKDEVLLAFQMPGNHAAGQYRLHVAILENATRKLAAPVHAFSADDGVCRIFTGQTRSFVFFAGSTTDQGWTTWQGGLWQPGPAWQMTWPLSANGQGVEAWWQDRAIRILPEGIQILDRQVLPRTSPDQLIPEFAWVPGQALAWDPDAETFTGSFGP